MAAKYTVNFFLEDNAQESIVPPLFNRIIAENGLDSNCFNLSVLHSRGGKSISALKSYLQDAKKRGMSPADCVVIGSDANCKGFVKKREMLLAEANGLALTLITVIPDPHIERWFLLDPAALSEAVGEKLVPNVPPYKCGKNEYKNRLKDAFKGSSVAPLSGGIEYGSEIAAKMNLYNVSKLDPGFEDFVRQAVFWLKSLRR
jgi:hypothetical protein